jgi:hypothetical protein
VLTRWISGPERAIRPRMTSSADEALLPLTPSTAVSNTAASLHSDVQAAKPSVANTPTRLQPRRVESAHGQPSNSTGEPPLVPYHAGESQGLDFLSDICQPVCLLDGLVLD